MLSNRRRRQAFTPYRVGDALVGLVQHPEHGMCLAQGVILSTLEIAMPAGRNRLWSITWAPTDPEFTGQPLRTIVGANGEDVGRNVRPGRLDDHIPVTLARSARAGR